MPNLAGRCVGIDVGAHTLHIAFAYGKGDPVYEIDLTDPLWMSRLLEMVAEGDTVAIEPTGWHYSAAVIQALDHVGVRVLIVEHRVTQTFRSLKISGVKTDKTDAKALAYAAATWDEQHYIGVNPARVQVQHAAMALRMMIHAYMRADKERTRAKNRIRQLAHSQNPTLANNLTVYLRAVEQGCATPADMHALADMLRAEDAVPRRSQRQYPELYRNESKRLALYDLLEYVPAWGGNNVIGAVILEEYAALVNVEARAERLRAEIERIAAEKPFGALSSLWMTIPSTGLLLCAALHAATRGLAAEMTPEQFRSAVGSHPRVSASGVSAESVRAMNGFRPAKRLLHLAEMSLIKQGENPIAETFARHKARGEKYAMQKARAKLVNILSGVARSGRPYNPALTSNAYKKGER